MDLLNDILQWANTLPGWQRDAMRRLFQHPEGLSNHDYDELYTLLKVAHGCSKRDNLVFKPLTSSHLSVSTQSRQKVILKELGELKHVNRIAPDQTLSFSKGMNIIYGDNGSGKSGYVRVMKNACRSRDPSEKIHPNVYSESNETPTAIFKVEHNDTSRDITWNRDQSVPDLLSNISVFDDKCARRYLTDQQEVYYLPYGLDRIENMARDVLPKLGERLSAEINSIDINNDIVSHLIRETSETEVSYLLSNLSHETNSETVEKLGTLSDEEGKKCESLSKMLAEPDPNEKANQLQRFVERLKGLAENIKKASLSVNDDAVATLKKFDDAVIEAESAEQNAAHALRDKDKELLPGTGEMLWKSLFEAAKEYSTKEAYPEPEHEFPHTGDGALCPLCQSPLDNRAGDRLRRFEEYIKSNFAKATKEKRNLLDAEIRKVMQIKNLQIVPEQALSDEISDINIIQVIKNYKESIDKRIKWILDADTPITHQWDELPVLTDNPVGIIRKLAAQKLQEARTLIKSMNDKYKKTLEKKYHALKARKKLHQSLNAVYKQIENMKKIKCLEGCNIDLQTNKFSNKSKELASKAVMKEFQKALKDEFDKFQVKNIQIELKEESRKGKSFYRILLKASTNCNIYEILSEGEQRIIALGAFLAELSLVNHSGDIVFDDPVSSLDHKYRYRVAKRLAEEAKNRQVIVFTHDIVFFHQLLTASEDLAKNEKKYDYKISHLDRSTEYVGYVHKDLPLVHRKYQACMKELKKQFLEVENKSKNESTCDYDIINDVHYMYNDLRGIIELAVQDVVLGGVVHRFDPRIKITGFLNKVVGFSEDDYDRIRRLYNACHSKIKAHSQPYGMNTYPTLEDFKGDMEELESIVKLITKRQKK